MVDVSDSMYGRALDIAIALGLVTSQLTTPPFTNTCITFSIYPEFHQIQGQTLQEKIKSIMKMNWGTNTDLMAVFKLILDRAQTNQLAPEKMVETLFIFTDMKFDHAIDTGDWKSTHTQIQDMYRESGYKMPHIVYWNLRSCSLAFPAIKDTPNVELVSGFSDVLIKGFMSGQEFDPMNIMLNTIQPYLDHVQL